VTELVPGHIEGWRAWRVTRDRIGGGLTLNSMVMLGVWRPGKPVQAWCPSGGETPCLVTSKFHACGIHGFGEKHRAVHYAERFTRSHPSSLFVVGRVVGAGRVVEHELGWRAARAAVLTLDHVVTARDVGLVGHDLLTQLRRRYRLAQTLEVR
jgi:hypothetical protein